MILVDRYHIYVHDAAAALGYQYSDTSPTWTHPFIHLIVVLTPVLVTAALLYLVVTVALKRARRVRHSDQKSQLIRGLYPDLGKSVLKYSKRQQGALIILSLTALPILYASLELPKRIVNNALNSSQFPLNFYGFSIDQVEFLLTLCGVYLVIIFIGCLNKYVLNLLKGYVAEKFCRRLRLLIYRQWRSQTSNARSIEIIPIIGQEVEAMGGFAAEFITLPLLQGGTLFTIVLFMLLQDPLLGLAALTVVPIQIILLPRLQRRVNEQSRHRIRKVRLLGGYLGSQLELVALSREHIKNVSGNFKHLEEIRRRIFRMKFFNKALNNFLTSLTPFMFYSLGGYFVIEERISLGALVAVLAAHKDFSSPMNELFSYYQMVEDTRIRYREILQFFKEKDIRMLEPQIMSYPRLLVLSSYR